MKWNCSQVRMQLLGVGAAPQVSALVRDFKGAEAKTGGGERQGLGAARRLDLLASLGAWLCLGHVDARNFN